MEALQKAAGWAAVRQTAWAPGPAVLSRPPRQEPLFQLYNTADDSEQGNQKEEMCKKVISTATVS